MSKSIRLLFHLCLVATATMALRSNAAAATSSEDVEEAGDGTIEVHYSAEVLAPFSERKSNWSGMFSLSVENFYPESYASPIDGGAYTALFGESAIPLAQINFGTKYNTKIGSFGLGAFYGTGSISDSSIDTKLTVQKIGGQATLALDSLFAEPWVVPYVSGQYFYIAYDEKGPADSASGETGFTMGVKAGVMIQLNALDPNSALRAQSEIGLNNTFLDLFMTKNQSTADDVAPEFETDVNWGAGFVLEF